MRRTGTQFIRTYPQLSTKEIYIRRTCTQKPRPVHKHKCTKRYRWTSTQYFRTGPKCKILVFGYIWLFLANRNSSGIKIKVGYYIEQAKNQNCSSSNFEERPSNKKSWSNFVVKECIGKWKIIIHLTTLITPLLYKKVEAVLGQIIQARGACSNFELNSKPVSGEVRYIFRPMALIFARPNALSSLGNIHIRDLHIFQVIIFYPIINFCSFYHAVQHGYTLVIIHIINIDYFRQCQYG